MIDESHRHRRLIVDSDGNTTKHNESTSTEESGSYSCVFDYVIDRKQPL